MTSLHPVQNPRVWGAFDVVWRHLVVEHRLDGVDADAIFCFGSWHARVPARAADLYAAGAAPTILVTGAAPSGETQTEADRIGADLVARGVPPEALLQEPRARNTQENVRFGMEVLRRTRHPRRLVIVSWPLATRRCLATFARQEPDLEILAAPALILPGSRWWPTRDRIDLALGEVDRLERYSDERHLVAPRPPAEWKSAIRVLRDWVDDAKDQRTTLRVDGS